jgi:hypothetical protein
MIDPDCPRGREYLTNRICIGRSASVLAPGQIHTDTKGQ